MWLRGRLMGFASLYPSYALQRYRSARPYIECRPPPLDHQTRIFEPLGFRQFLGVSHAGNEARRIEGPVVRHERVDEQLAVAGPVGGVVVAELAAQRARDRVAYDALMQRLAAHGDIDNV